MTKKAKWNLSPRSTQPDIIFHCGTRLHRKKRQLSFLFCSPSQWFMPKLPQYAFCILVQVVSVHSPSPLRGAYARSHQRRSHHHLKSRSFFLSGLLISMVTFMDVVNIISKLEMGERPSSLDFSPREKPLFLFFFFLFQSGTRKGWLDTLKQVLLLIHWWWWRRGVILAFWLRPRKTSLCPDIPSSPRLLASLKHDKPVFSL